MGRERHEELSMMKSTWCSNTSYPSNFQRLNQSYPSYPSILVILVTRVTLEEEEEKPYSLS